MTRRASAPIAPALLILLLALVEPSAHADIRPGACVLTLALDYEDPIGPDSGAVDVDFSGSPTGTICRPTPGNATQATTVNLDGNGTTTTISTCEKTFVVGTYTMTFGAGFPASVGDFKLSASLGSMTLVLVDLDSPVLIGAGTLALDPNNGANVGQASGCIDGETTSLTYVGAIGFLDP